MRIVLTLLATVMAVAPAYAADELKASLTGAAEVPGPGDEDGTGAATVTIDKEKGQVCYTLSVSGIDAATMAHIHDGAAGAAGPPVVTLDAPANGASEGCKAATPEVLDAIATAPQGYYVNVHNAAFPKGAVRGQLGQ